MRGLLADVDFAHGSESAFYRFENGVQVQVIAEVHELLAQHPDVQPARHVHDHLHGEHRRAGMRGGIGARRQLGDVDAALRRRIRKGPRRCRSGPDRPRRWSRAACRCARPALRCAATECSCPWRRPSFLNSPSSLARVCQLPLTSSSMANSLPSEVMRLSLMLPPQSAIALESSWTMPTRSPPTAEITICCFIGAKFYRMGACQGACPPLKVAIFRAEPLDVFRKHGSDCDADDCRRRPGLARVGSIAGFSRARGHRTESSSPAPPASHRRCRWTKSRN